MGCANFVFPRWEQSTGSERGLWQRRRRERGCCVVIRPWPISCLGRTHPRAVAVDILEGAFTFDHEGKATMTYKAGDTLYIEANKIHEGINKGTSPVKALAGSMGLDALSHRRTRLVLLARRKVNSGRIKVAGNGVTHGVRATRDID